MDWFIFALLAALFWSTNNTLYKILLEKKFKNLFSFAIFLILFDTAFVVCVLLTKQISFLYPYSLLMIGEGVMSVAGYWFFCKAVQKEEISRVTSLIQMVPIFVAILSAVFLKEILSAQQYAGIILIVIAAVLISQKKIKSVRILSPAFKFILVFVLNLAISAIINKYVLNFIDYWSTFVWFGVGTFSAILFLISLPKIRRDFVKDVRNLDKKTILSSFSTETVWFLGMLSELIAFSTGPAPLVSSVVALQPFLVLLLAIALSVFKPKILKEELTRSTITTKLIAIFLIFIGIWLLNVI